MRQGFFITKSDKGLLTGSQRLRGVCACLWRSQVAKVLSSSGVTAIFALPFVVFVRVVTFILSLIVNIVKKKLSHYRHVEACRAGAVRRSI